MSATDFMTILAGASHKIHCAQKSFYGSGTLAKNQGQEPGPLARHFVRRELSYVAGVGYRASFRNRGFQSAERPCCNAVKSFAENFPVPAGRCQRHDFSCDLGGNAVSLLRPLTRLPVFPRIPATTASGLPCRVQRHPPILIAPNVRRHVCLRKKAGLSLVKTQTCFLKLTAMNLISNIPPAREPGWSEFL